MSQPVWFITGVSNGFGLLLTLRALKAGHSVIGTVRNKAKHTTVVQQIEAAGGKIIEMDMTESQESIQKKVKAAGRIDYLINNAGYSIFGPLEQMSTLYAASKAALEAVSESLAKELSSFGIKVLIVNPGAFRTNFLAQVQLSENPLPDDYKNNIVGTAIQKFSESHNQQIGDPDKGVERIFEIVTGEGMAGELKGKVNRLVIGEDAFTRMKNNNDKLVHDFMSCEKVALSTGFD
ncbi:hypothetical protein ONZ43_g5428 [Nemania bipapillata]|uniref:Uncharacterized protein n=1 Tax=Nemania bipapillata TaxID=110536 RepID=A0ACC2IAZ7_9PEZI|nr:hypothetical protein ONZ43_g5428 [Nemania bipapillata]